MILLIVLGALLVVGVALIPVVLRFRRLADGRGVGVLRPDRLRFTAQIRTSEHGPTQVRLAAESKRRRPRKARPSGYTGVSTTHLSWTPSPMGSDRWWRRGASGPDGIIDVDRELAAQPWERILAASLGRGAVGRVEWVRHLRTTAAPYVPDASSKRAVEIDSPVAWRTQLARGYLPILPVSVRHAVGRAVDTSAGPRFDVSGEATARGSRRNLLDPRRLLISSPALVVLQAEPTDQAVDPGLQDDLPERLTLAVDLIEGGAPAVLIVPALPAALMQLLPEAMAELAGSAQRVLARLRRDLGPHVEPAVLDDIVLFVNPEGAQ